MKETQIETRESEGDTGWSPLPSLQLTPGPCRPIHVFLSLRLAGIVAVASGQHVALQETVLVPDQFMGCTFAPGAEDPARSCTFVSGFFGSNDSKLKMEGKVQNF